MTAAAGTCNSSSRDATDRCTFSSGHSTAMGKTKGRTTPPLHGERLFATRSGYPIGKIRRTEAVVRRRCRCRGPRAPKCRFVSGSLTGHRAG